MPFARERPLVCRAPAKINLTLDVLGKRPDDYHDLLSVMQTIAISDALVLHPAPPGEFSVICDVDALCGDDNLAVRAARAICAATAYPGGVRIELRKEIPVQAGLGGGSSDAAAVLLALNAWWELGLDRPALIDLAATLGSDVPFFIAGGTALVEGRGEIVTPLPDLWPLWLVIVKPPVSISTARIFRALTPSNYSDGRATRVLVAAIRSGQQPELSDDVLFNALEPGVLHGVPEVARARDLLVEAGAPVVRMSGSGPTLYAPFATLQEALPIWRAMQRAGMQAWLAQTIPADSTT
jgi:4-diphosphocytidyl-2-C-methyl-D-erythritol kinase